MCVLRQIRVTPFVVVALICALTITPTTGHAEERHVPDPYLTIQDAISACNDYDVVIVANGTYTGEGNYNLDFSLNPPPNQPTRTIIVRSLNDDPELCTIDCDALNPSADRRGFNFHTGETAECVVRGFTITQGYMAGGAIRCYGSSPTIMNCILNNNTAYERQGGAIYCDNGSSPVIANCRFEGNSAPNGANGLGGAIYCGLSHPVRSSSIA